MISPLNKQTKRKLLLFISIWLILAIIIALISYLFYPNWLEFWPLLLIAAAGGSLAILDQLGGALGFISEISSDPVDALNQAPLISISTEQLVARLGTSAQIDYIDRHATSLDLLNTHGRLVITGPMNIGKTREAIELISQVVKRDLVAADRLFMPSPFGWKQSEDITNLLLSSAAAYAPMLLFIDDLPKHFPDENALTKLEEGIKTIRQTARTVYVITTSRNDKLSEIHQAWLTRNRFHSCPMAKMNREQVGALVDNAGKLYQKQFTENARKTFVNATDGLPGNILLTFQLDHKHSATVVDEKSVAEFATRSVEQNWANIRRQLLEEHPASEHILVALSGFHKANVRPFERLVMSYATLLWKRAGVPPVRSFQRQKMLQIAEKELAYINIKAQNGIMTYPDFVVENEPTPKKPKLPKFLVSYRPPSYTILTGEWPDLAFECQLALFDLGNQAETLDKQKYYYAFAMHLGPERIFPYFIALSGDISSAQGEHDAAISDYDRAIKLNPKDAQIYIKRGVAYSQQGHLKRAIKDYDTAIALDPKLLAAFLNRGYNYEKLGDLDRAITDFTHAIAGFSEAANAEAELALAYYHRGTAHSIQGNSMMAVADFQNYLEIQPEASNRSQVETLIQELQRIQ